MRKHLVSVKLVVWKDTLRAYFTRRRGSNWFNTKVYKIDQQQLVNIALCLRSTHYYLSDVSIVQMTGAVQCEFKLIGRKEQVEYGDLPEDHCPYCGELNDLCGEINSCRRGEDDNNDLGDTKQRLER